MWLHSRREVASGTALSALLLLFPAVLLSSCGPADPLAEIRELHASGSYSASIEPLRDLIAAHPGDTEVLYLHGVALARSGEPSLAMWSFRKAMEDPAWVVRAGISLTASALATGNHPAAVEAAGRVLEAEPDHVQALVLRAQARLATRVDHEGALADADRALELDPDNDDARVQRSVALLALERVEEAAVVLEELEERFRDSDRQGPAQTPRFCAARAIFAKEKGEIETAEQRFEDCLEEFPASSLVVEAAIEFYDEQRSSERPVEILRAALEAVPTAVGLRTALAARLRAAGETEEAERILLDGTELEAPGLAAPTWASLADHYVELEDYAAAASALEHALNASVEPAPQLVFAYADALVMAGRYERAIEVADQLTIPSLRDLVYGRALLEQGKPAEALERFSEGLRLSPNNAVARYYAARAAEGIGDFDRAVSEYRYSIRAEPSATDARLQLALLHEAEGAYGLALKAAHHRTSRGPSAPDLETELASFRIAARAGRLAAEGGRLGQLAGRPEVWGRAVAAVAEGIRTRLGPAAAAQRVREAPGLDLSDPRNAEVLRGLVSDLAETGEADAARAYLDAALAAHPKAAAFHEIRGFALERRGAPADEVRAAYERAVELDPENALALAGLGRMAAASEAALGFYARAAAADPEDPAPQRASAELLVSLGKREEAERKLLALLAEHPYDGGIAARLAELRLAREAESDRTLQLAKRAARFGGGPEAHELVARVHRQRGELDRAEAAASEAKAMRSRAERTPVEPDA